MAKKKQPTKLRFERRFDSILSRLTKAEDKHTRCIVEALCVIAEELNDLNGSASELESVPGYLEDAIGHLEKIDSQTDEVTELTRQSLHG
jgi:hypothetical protein